MKFEMGMIFFKMIYDWPPKQIVRVDSPHLCSQTAVSPEVGLQTSQVLGLSGRVSGLASWDAKSSNHQPNQSNVRWVKKDKHRVVKEDEFTA